MTYVGKLDPNRVYGADALGAVGGVAGGGAARPYPTDANDLHVWSLNEAAGETSFANSGTSALTLSPVGTLTSGSAGIWDSGVLLFESGAAYLTSGDTADQPASDITVSVWIRPTNDGNLFAFGKQCRSTAWNAPYYAAWMIQRNSSQTYFDVTTLGDGWVTVGASGGLAPDVVLNTWNHVGMTYDSVTLRCYVNGNEVKAYTLPIGGALVYSDPGPPADGPGPYVIGADRATTSLLATYADARVASVVRPASWFRDVYRRGLYGL